jgi:hypothetical protein
MSGVSAAPSGRALIERQMTSTCRIFTMGDPVTDPTTGEVTRTEIDAVTTKCRVRPRGSRISTGANAGGAEVIVTGYIVSVPFDFTPVPRDFQRLVVTASPDPGLVGMSLQIRDVALGDAISARRLLCQVAE